MREAVALAVLAVAVGIGVWFATGGSTDGDRHAVVRTVTPSGGARDDTVTVTVGPIDGDGVWDAAFFRLAAGKEPGSARAAELVTGSQLPSLDLTFTGAPLPELEGDDWRLTAEMTFTGPPGAYEIRLQYRGGPVELRLNGKELTHASSQNRVRVLRANFVKGPEDALLTVSIEGDEGGGLVRWQLLPR